MNLAYLLESGARSHPDKAALKCGGTTMTYAALNAAANQLANGLIARGVQAGDRVALSCISIPPFVISYYAILKVGAVAVPLNLLLKKDEIAEQLGASGAKVYICFEGTAEAPLGPQGLAAFEATDSCEQFYAIAADPSGLGLLAGQPAWHDLLAGQSPVYEAIRLSGDTTCSITFTSGTTGTPKGTEHTHVTEWISAMAVRTEMEVRGDDVLYCALPLFSLWRVAILHCTLLTGATAVIAPRFDPIDAWQTMARERVSVFLGVGPMFFGLKMVMDKFPMDYDAIAQHWRLVMYGGMPFEHGLRQLFQDRFGLDMRQGYGLTEVVFAVLDKAPDKNIPSRLGRPIPGVQVRVVDEDMNDVPIGELGEIVVRSPMAMKGYFQRDDWTAEAFRGGWFHTGDIGKWDEDGNLYLEDRLKDMINRGSFKVYPAQLEQVLVQHPAVANAAVIGIPDERLGEEVQACVILRDGHACTEAELIAWAKERVAAYAYPRRVRFVEQLPLNPTGKVLKRVLRETLSV